MEGDALAKKDEATFFCFEVALPVVLKKTTKKPQDYSVIIWD